MRKPGLLLAASILIAGVVAGWLARDLFAPSKAADAQPSESADVVAPSEMEVQVTTSLATSGDMPLTVPAIGVVRAAPNGTVTLSSRAGGRILEALVAPGRIVRKGDPIVKLDPLPLEAAVASARGAAAAAANALSEYERNGRSQKLADLTAAEERAAAQVGLAESQAERLAPLAKDGLISDRALAEAQQAVNQAKRDRSIASLALESYRRTGDELQKSTLVAGSESAAAQLREAETNLGAAEVFAPADGQVIDFPLHPGDKVDPGGALGSLRPDGGPVAVSFGVSAQTAKVLKPGARATYAALSETDPRRVETGRLTSVLSAVNPMTGLMEVVVEPDDGAPPDPPGLVVRGDIETGRIDGATLVPEEAVVRDGDRPVVVTVGKDGIAKKHAVEVLASSGGLAAVSGDVHPGDRVVVSGAYNLPDGARTVEKPEGGAGESQPSGERPEPPAQ